MNDYCLNGKGVVDGKGVSMKQNLVMCKPILYRVKMEKERTIKILGINEFIQLIGEVR